MKGVKVGLVTGLVVLVMAFAIAAYVVAANQKGAAKTFSMTAGQPGTDPVSFSLRVTSDNTGVKPGKTASSKP